MSLDAELMKFDGMGLIPRENETKESYLHRCVKTIMPFPDSDLDKYAREALKDEGIDEIFLPNDSDRLLIKEASRRVQARFGCDLSWVRVCYADMGLGDGLPRAYSYGCIEFEKEGRLLIVPPLIVVNSAVFGKFATYMHEMVHIPTRCINAPQIAYAGWKKYHERVANEVTLFYQLKSLVEINPRISFEFLCIKHRLKRTLGHNANYVLIRLSYEEARDFFYERKLNPVELICRNAERGRLKYKIMKERLRL